MARAATAAVAGTLALLLAASAAVFLLVRIAPGDVVDVEFSASGAATFLDPEREAEVRDERRRALGLDGSLPAQYVRWLSHVMRGDLGDSFRTGRPVTAELGERLPASVMLGTAGFVIGGVLGSAAALIAARRPDGLLDHVTRVATLATAAVPTFLSGSVALRYGAERWGYDIAGPASAGKLWLPALVLGVAIAPTFSRVLRAALVAERSRLYALAARARGASRSRVTRRHTLRPALSPVLTLAGLALASLLGGSVITEVIFGWPGVGAYAVGAIRAQDYPVVQAYVLLMTAVVIVVNRTVDGLQRVLDPRVADRAEAVG